MRSFIFISVSLAILFAPAFAVLEIPNAQPKVGAEQWKVVLDNTWAGMKVRNIKECESKPIYNGQSVKSGLICRPKSETPWDAVSEGIGYGMLLALYADDQETFDLIYKAGKGFSMNYCQNWRQPPSGGRGDGDGGSASDADEDIAAALIFAAKLREKGKWKDTGINYGTDATSAVNCVRGLLSNGLLKPGSNWCPGSFPGAWGCGAYNPGYFAPAWFRLFKAFDANNASTWDNAISKSYELIASNPGFSKGLIPDWTNASGQTLSSGPGYNAYLNGNAFFKDAIRMLWRVANDVIWFPNEHSENSTGRTYLKNAVNFITDKGGPKAANFYAMNGNLIPENDKWTDFNDNKNSETWRWRREHSHLTVGQWLTAAMAVGTDEQKKAWSSKMAEFYDWENKVDFFGNVIDPNPGGIEDTLHNEMYFDQFLAWFGVSLMSGTWVNVVALLDNPVANTAGILDLPWPSEPDPDPDPDPPLIVKRNHLPGIQISQSPGTLRMSSKNDVSWKIHDLQGKLLFSSKSRETSWNVGNFKGMAVVSANSERKLIAIR